MVCWHCGYQNSDTARYCGGCGRKLMQKKREGHNWWIWAATLLLIIVIVAGLLFTLDRPEKLICSGIPICDEVSAEIAQVLPLDDGAVAVLYKNGTVKVSGNTYFAEAVSDWSQITELYYDRFSAVCEYEPLLAGLTENGSVMTTEVDLSSWSSIKKLLFTYEGIVGISVDGSVLAYGTWEDDSFLTSLSNVEDLVYADIQDTWGCLRKDGSVILLNDCEAAEKVYWNNVEELRDSGHAFYVIKKDGTIDGGLEDSYAGLKGAVKVVDYQDWLFGISSEGKLLTHNNGNIYTNTGDLMVDSPDSPYYSGEVNIRQFNQVKDILIFWGMILLNEDGTVDAIGEYPSWELGDWDNIEKIYGTSDDDWENITLYGIRQDGSVIITRYNLDRMVQTVEKEYCGWKLRDIYVGNGGVVGLSMDGKLVGDGIYENTDFSIF